MAPGKGEYTKDGSIFPDRAGGYDLGGRIMSIRFTAPASKQLLQADRLPEWMKESAVNMLCDKLADARALAASWMNDRGAREARIQAEPAVPKI